MKMQIDLIPSSCAFTFQSRRLFKCLYDISEKLSIIVLTPTGPISSQRCTLKIILKQKKKEPSEGVLHLLLLFQFVPLKFCKEVLHYNRIFFCTFFKPALSSYPPPSLLFFFYLPFYITPNYIKLL